MSPRKYVVVPPMEGGLENLRKIAGNLWFSWNMEAVELFDYLDERLWTKTNHSPLQTMIQLSRQRLGEIRQDEGFLAHSERVYRHFRAYMDPAGAYEYGLEQPLDFTTAYFSLEFGLTESLPLYSGGLGVLAGDHLKSASDLMVPLVGVGLLYQDGYFRQKLSADGWQHEIYPRTEIDTLPLERQQDAFGGQLLIAVDLAGETLWSRVLKINVGRVPLYLLDTDIPENSAQLRNVTAKLYGGDAEMRIRQEILLGIGGCKVLDSLGVKSAVYHLNEGHAAFALLERLRYFMEEQGLSLEEAREMVTSQSILTIHTPVPAGNDVFERGLMEKYFGGFCKRLGLNFEDFLGMGRLRPSDATEGFCLTVLGLKTTSQANGVSVLHSRVAKDMWHEVWPQAERRDIPIAHLTNGVHIPSYISRDLHRLYDRYLEPGWTEDPDNEKIWQKAEKIPDTELWRTHERCRSRLVNFTRRRVAHQLKARGASPAEQEVADHILDPETLTICFGRRFAAYKRATLLFREPDRLAKLLDHPERPAQLVFAGKAHPADDTGKEMIKRIVQLAREEPFRSRVAFIEDYDMNVCRYMVQGADVWLNTPRRPMEACGTSGMKAAANGALNLSTLDGWWDEGYRGDNGWAIGRGEEYDDFDYQDDIESRALYDILEQSVKPLFYTRGVDDLPREWLSLMKQSIRTICPVFNSHRMVSEYVEDCYLPSARSSLELSANDYAPLKEMVAWKKEIRRDWDKIIVRHVEISDEVNAMKGKHVEVIVGVDTAGHSPDEIKVELLHGPIDLWENFKECLVAQLTPAVQKPPASGEVLFSGLISLTYTGLYGYVVRVTPQHPNLASSHRFELVHTG
ncbi:MAG TPA: alpha-glucan family phosphorylase [Desulfomonilaceae bacterium]|nr:alpha-glucan family phosphorylase [Desulfomonilaceae bacterium]